MLEAIIDEIRIKGSALRSRETTTISTIYFGGGTPSLLTPNELNLLMQAITENFDIDRFAEVTFEANPENINPVNLDVWLSSGINRLSVGLQSFLDEDLKWMNRVHDAQQAEQAIVDINRSGFTNYSVDLIFGTPTLFDDDWKENVHKVLNYDVPHLAAYALTVEPSTALEKMIASKKKAMVDPAKQADQFLMLMTWMEVHGYEHYEISNFCKPGQRSKHNSSYWNGTPYIGIGPSAHSFDGVTRSWNVSNNSMYISLDKSLKPFGEETLTTLQQLNEYIMTSLRTLEGLDLTYVDKLYGVTYKNRLERASKIYQERDHIIHKNDKLILTRNGKLFADGIAAALFF